MTAPAVPAARPVAGAGPTACVGVLITVPEPLAGRLQPWRRRFVSPAPEGVPPHITLLPPTLVPAAQLAVVEDHLAAVLAGTGSFEVHLRGSGTFLPVSPVTFVQVAAGIGGCELLEARIRSGPLQRPLNFPYHPHVTVAQNVDRAVLDRVDADLARFDARFEVAAVDLYQARAGELTGPWGIQASFALSAGPRRTGRAGRPRPRVTRRAAVAGAGGA